LQWLQSRLIVRPQRETGAYVTHRPIGVWTSQNAIGENGDTFILAGSNINLDAINNSNSTFIVRGDSDQLSLGPMDANETVIDQGMGTNLWFYALRGPVTVLGFGNDRTGTVSLFNMGYLNADQAAAAMKPDGHGGWTLGEIDFVGAHPVAAQLRVINT
jgi:hypothetical protein